MIKRLTQSVLPTLCALMLLCTMVSPVWAAFGSGDMPWLKEQSLLDQILERDGFIDGIWYPWLNSGSTGHNLCGNEVMATYYGSSEAKAKEWSRVELDYHGADKVYREIYNLKAMGYNMMAWGGSIYAEGVQLDVNTGEVLGIKEEYLTNARRLLNICREIGMPVVWNVYFHSSSMPQYYGVDGWHVVTRMCADNKVADQYAEKFVRPLCKMLAEYKDVIAMVSIADEPENEVNDAQVGNHFEGTRAMYGVDRADMLYLLTAINNAVKAELPGMPRTIASTGGQNKSMYADFALDLMGHNNYSNNANMPDVENFKTNRPMILAEYNVGGDAGDSDDELTSALIAFRKNMMKKGYKGGLQWCWMPNASSRATSYYLLTSAPKSNTDFRATVTDLRHYMDEYRAEYRDKTITVDAAVLYANDGTGLVEWIPSKRGVKMDLLRSNDGGNSWVKVLDDVDQAAYVGATKKGSYKDAKTSNSMYKIVVRDAKGNAAASAPNNAAGADQKHKQTYTVPQLPAQTGISVASNTWKVGDRRLLSFGMVNNRPASASVNLIQNGSFESTGGQWSAATGAMVSVVTDKTAPDGSKSLYFNSTAAKSGDYNTKFTVKVQKNTDYVFSTWIKGTYLSSANKGHASIGVINPDTGKFLVHVATKISEDKDGNKIEKYDSGNSRYPRASREDQQIYPTAWDDEWHLRSVCFNSGDQTEVTIAFYGYGSKIWLDDMALFKNGDGIKYVGTNMASDLRVNFYSDKYSCEDDKCANQNPSVSSGDYWSGGAGWDSGFMSVVSDGKSGKALQYSANTGAGEYYIRWVDVAPHTEYVFSVDAKILKSGGGRIGLVTDHLLLPIDAVFLEFDAESYGSDWFDFCVTFNTSGFTRVGIGVCDLGGQALFDNIQIFKASDGKPVTENDGPNTTDTPPGNTGDTSDPNSDGSGGGDGDGDFEPPAFNGPMILLVSFGGTAVLVGIGVGIYFLIRAIIKKKKATPAPPQDKTE